MNTKKYHGYWWVPGHPDNRVAGTLSVNNGRRAELHLHGCLVDMRNRSAEGFNIDLLHGESGGKPITLYGCLEKSRSFSFGSTPATSRVSASAAFVGTHFASLDDIKFRHILVTYTFLNDWVHSNGMEVHENAEGNGLVITALPSPKCPPVRIRDTVITVHGTRPLHSGSPNRLSVKRYSHMRISSDDKKHYSDYNRTIFHLGNFLSFAVTRATQVRSIWGYVDADGDELNPREQVQIFDEVFLQPRRKTVSVAGFEMLFTLDDVAARLDQLLHSWISKSEHLEPIYNLFFATFHDRTMYAEHRFLSLTQALESYHRRTFGGKYMQDQEFRDGPMQQLVQAVPATLTTDFQQALKAKLQYLHEYSLSKRLGDLLRTYADPISHLIHAHRRFATDVNETRNYLTHYDEAKKEKAKSGHALNKLSDYVQFVLEVCLLIEMGFPMSEVKDLVSTAWKYRNMGRWSEYR